MLTTEQGEQLDELLGTSIAGFDVPDDVYHRAVERYEDAARWLADRWPDDAGVIYTQGSIRLGTMVTPVSSRDEYDIDLVCRRDLAKTSTSQQALKDDVGFGLLDYAASSPEGGPQLREGKRCWTLDYPGEPFHMDVLPALPDREEVANAILLTDRELRAWQRSNPVDFSAWFLAKMEPEVKQVREALAARMDVQQAPPSIMKTTLQRSVQALKRHRDMHFSSNPDDRPASIIITTLAAKAYRGGGPVHEVLVGVTERMPHYVERRDGDYWVENPVAAKENFADRWAGHPERADRFFDWIEQAHADFAHLGDDLGIDRVLAKIARSFGDAPAKRAGQRFGARLSGAREVGALGMGAGGLLVPATARAIPRHTFHGDAPPTTGS